eukprot:515434-Pyramimonas_sp.AAC.2
MRDKRPEPIQSTSAVRAVGACEWNSMLTPAICLNLCAKGRSVSGVKRATIVVFVVTPACRMCRCA